MNPIGFEAGRPLVICTPTGKTALNFTPAKKWRLPVTEFHWNAASREIDAFA